MKLPQSRHASIDDTKLRDYLLSVEHPVGHSKALFFLALGYRRERWRRLRDDLLALARSGDAIAGKQGSFGRKFEVRGTIEGLSGRKGQIVTIWIIRRGERVPRFVTAYPGDSS